MLRIGLLVLFVGALSSSAWSQTGDRARYTQLVVNGSQMVLHGLICDGKLNTTQYATLARNEFAIALAHSTYGSEHPEQRVQLFVEGLPTPEAAASSHPAVQVTHEICSNTILTDSRRLYIGASELYLSAGRAERDAADYRERRLREAQEQALHR